MIGLLVLATALLGYLIGAIPFGYLVARARGINIFEHGSGNIGATNVGRVLGRKFGLLVFVLDFCKGALPAAAGWVFAPRLSDELAPDLLGVVAGVAALLGHLFPVYLRFHGGKGVATAAGVVTVLLPGPALGALLAWLVVASATHYVSLASLVAALVLCLLRFALTPQSFDESHRVLSLFCLLAAFLVFLRHRSNVKRLLAGTENRLPESPTMTTLAKILHVLALGLWFGMTIFFTFVVAFSLFGTFDHLAQLPATERDRQPFASDFDKTKATQVAGIAISPLFTWYYRLAAGCGLVATILALAWARAHPTCRVHRWRAIVLVLALATVAAGWWLADKVNELRLARYGTDAVAEQARAAFGAWHGYSVAVNLATALLVTVAMALAAGLPGKKTETSA
jgi:acyl-phosphate glycerol 3-phosphate acyltransferase